MTGGRGRQVSHWDDPLPPTRPMRWVAEHPRLTLAGCVAYAGGAVALVLWRSLDDGWRHALLVSSPLLLVALTLFFNVRRMAAGVARYDEWRASVPDREG